MAISAEEGKKIVEAKDEADIFREMIMRYGIFDLETAREILNRKVKGKLSDTVINMREEE